MAKTIVSNEKWGIIITEDVEMLGNIRSGKIVWLSNSLMISMMLIGLKSFSAAALIIRHFVISNRLRWLI